MGIEGSALLFEKSCGCNVLDHFITELQVLFNVGGIGYLEPNDGRGNENGGGTESELE